MFERSQSRSSSFEESIPLKSSEGQKSLRRKQDELKSDAETLKRAVIVASIMSVVLNLIMAIVAFIVAAMRDSAATYAFGADCFLDLTSSTILLWRFFGKDDFDAVRKERKACILLGVLFVISAVAVICKASIDITQGDEPLTFEALYVLSVFGTVICFSMAIAKGILAKKVRSDSLMLDALNSVISGLLAFVIIASDLVYKYDHGVWYMEPLMSIILSIFLVCYGLKVIKDHWKMPEIPPEILP